MGFVDLCIVASMTQFSGDHILINKFEDASTS